MTYQKIDFLSQSAIHYEEGCPDTIVISIRNSRSEPARIRDGFKAVLFMEFDNVEHLTHRDIRFSLRHAEEIFAFVAEHEATASRILVNCMAGETRSAAVAMHLAKKYALPLKRSTKEHSKWVLRVLDQVAERAADRAERLQTNTSAAS